MSTILIVEDEADIRAVLEYNLTQAGYETVQASTGAQALQVARTTPIHLVLLDLMLPDRSGTDICRALRKEPATAAVPIIILTARTDEIDRVVGFEVGADDYVVKPFSVRELLLRIQVILRRKTSDSSPGTPIAFGPVRVDKEAHRVWMNDVEIALTALEFKLLCTLYERRNRVQSRDTLLGDVWGMRSDVNTRTVDTHVKRLREKLSEAGEYIQTVRGVGYRLATTPGEEMPS